MKFSVVPESSSAEVSALLNKEFRYMQIVIDQRFDRYTLLVLNALTKAELVRRPENPLPRLLLSPLRSALLPGLIGRWTWLLAWWLFCPRGSRWWSWCLTSSRPIVPWLRAVSSSGWDSCVRSVRLDCIRNRHRGGLGQRCRGFDQSIGFGRRSLGRRFLVRLAFGPSSLGGFGSSSCCSGLRVLGPHRRPLGRGRCSSDGGHWWSYTLGCWGS
jgi:hypothetical protein